MRSHRFIVAFAWLSCLGLGLPTVAQAQPLSERVPEDAKVYVGWSGVDEMGPGFAGSNFEGFLRVVDVERMGRQAIDTLKNFAAAEGAPPEDLAGFDTLAEVVSALWHKPTCFYFSGLTPPTGPGGEPMPRMALICEVGQEKAEALRAKILALGDAPPPEINFEARDGFLVLSVGITPGEVLNPTAPLSKSKRFKEAMEFVHKPACFAAYVDSPAVLAMIDSIGAQEAPPEEYAQFKKVVEALGLTGLGRVVISAGFEGKDWMTSAFLEAPAPRKGLLKLIETAPIDKEAFKLVPATAEWASVTHFDLAAAYDTVIGAIREVDPAAVLNIEAGVAQASSEAGFRIVDDLLRSMGGDWVIYSDASLGYGMTGAALVHPLRDAGKFDAALTALENKVQPLLAEGMERGPFGVLQITRTQSGEVTVRSINILFYAVSWSVHDGRFYLAMFPQTIAAAAKNAEAEGPTLMESEKLKGLLQRLGKRDYHGLAYADLSRTMPQMYQAALMGSQMLQAMGAQRGMAVQPLTLPPINELTPYFTQSASIGWSDERGIHSRSISPFPGAELASPSGMMSTAVVAAGVGILLPALGRAREAANMSVSAAHLHGIGNALNTYALNNRQRYPLDLGAIVPNLIGAEMFVNPRLPNRPKPPENATPEELIAWVEENSDYVIRPVKTMRDRPNGSDILAYERYHPELSDGLAFLYTDGSVEVVRDIQQALQILRDAGEEVPPME